MIRRIAGTTHSHFTLRFSCPKSLNNNNNNRLFCSSSSSRSSSSRSSIDSDIFSGPTTDSDFSFSSEDSASVDRNKQPNIPVSAKDFAFIQQRESNPPFESICYGFLPESVLISKAVKGSRSSDFDLKTEKILRRLRGKLNERVVIEVIEQVNHPEFCIKFFTWAGRQIGYSHTGLTYETLISVLGFDEQARVSQKLLKEIENEDHEVLTKLLNVLIRKCCHNGQFNLALEELSRLKNFNFRPSKVTYYALIQVLSVSNQLEMAFSVYKEMSNSGFFLDKSTMGIFANSLCLAGKWAEALNLIEREDFQLDTILCTQMIKGLLEASLFEESMDFLHRMRANNCVPNFITYRTLLSGFLKKKQLGWCKRILKEMIQEGCNPNPTLFNSLLNAFCKEGDFDYAYKLITKMENCGIKPGYVTYNILIGSICSSNGSNGSLDLAEKAYDEMLEKGIILNKINVENFAKCLCDMQKFEKAFNIIKEMMKRGFVPDTSTYSKVLSLFCQFNKIENAIKLFEEMKRVGSVPDVYTYTILIDSFCKLGFVSQARVWFEEMGKNGCNPNVVTYTSIIHAYLKNKEINQANLIFERMVRMGCNPNLVTYTALIDGFCKAGEINKACLIYERMIGNCEKSDVEIYFEHNNENNNENFEPNVVTYGALMDGLCKAHKVNEAQSLLNAMRESNKEPNCIVYDALIDGFCKADKLEDAQQVFVEMTEKGYIPNLYTYSSLIDKLFKDKRLDLAMKVLCKMLDSKIGPNVVIYTEMIDGLCKVGKLEEALKLFDLMQEKGCKPNVITYTSLIDGLCKFGKIEHALKLFDEMSQKGIAPNIVTFRVLINHCCKLGFLENARELLDEMKLTHWPRNIKGFKNVIQGFSKEFLLSLNLVDDVARSDWPPIGPAYGILINSFCKVGKLEIALELYEEIKEGLRADFESRKMYFCLIEALCLGFKVQKGFEIYCEMINKGHIAEMRIFVCLIKGLIKVNMFDEAMQLCYSVYSKVSWI